MCPEDLKQYALKKRGRNDLHKQKKTQLKRTQTNLN